MDFQTRSGRLKKQRKNRAWMTSVFLFLILASGLFFAVKELAESGAEYQCARLEQQFRDHPEVFFITQLESKMCPELQAPVKEIIN